MIIDEKGLGAHKYSYIILKRTHLLSIISKIKENLRKISFSTSIPAYTLTDEFNSEGLLRPPENEDGRSLECPCRPSPAEAFCDISCPTGRFRKRKIQYD
ncbi:MAG: hypothetical protein HPY61_07285 [Methanotrichaceae archaeon]|nr:hypothetical protein [Methanotrichaceae archaeon]